MARPGGRATKRRRAAPVFRDAAHTDVDVLVELVRQYYLFDHIVFDEPRVRRALAELLDNPSFGRVWLITAEGNPVGYMVLVMDFSIESGGRDAFLDELYLVPSHRRLGIGALALQQAEAVCRELGLHALHLQVEQANAPAQGLYRKAGFEAHTRLVMTKVIDRS